MSVPNPYANLPSFPAETAERTRSFPTLDTLKVFSLPPRPAQRELGGKSRYTQCKLSPVFANPPWDMSANREITVGPSCLRDIINRSRHLLLSLFKLMALISEKDANLQVLLTLADGNDKVRTEMVCSRWK